MVLMGKENTMKSNITTASEFSNQIPRRLSTSQKVRDFFSLGYRAHASPKSPKQIGQPPVTGDHSHIQTSNMDIFKNTSMAAHPTKQQEQSKQKGEKADGRVTKQSERESESVGMESPSRRHRLFRGGVYNSVAEAGKSINKQMISAPMAAQSSLGHERPPQVPLKEERGRERFAPAAENPAHVYTRRAATGAEVARGRPSRPRSESKSKSGSSPLSTPSPSRTSSPTRRVPGKHRKSGSFGRLGFCKGTSADASVATRRDPTQSVCKLGSYMGTSADVLDATRREVAANIRRSTEKVVSIVRSPFEHSRYQSDSDSDESFYCIGEAKESTERLNQGRGPGTGAQQHKCRVCRKAQPAGRRELCSECQRRFRRSKTNYDSDGDEKGKLKPPKPLMSEAKSLSSPRARIVQESPLVPTLRTSPVPFTDQHEISLAPSFPTAERLFRNATSGTHSRPAPAASAPDPQTTFAHHANSSDESVSPTSPLAPSGSPSGLPSLLVSPAGPAGQTKYASPYEQWQTSKLRAQYEGFENPRGLRFSVPSRPTSGGAGYTDGDTGDYVTGRGGLQAMERLGRGELAVEPRYRGFI